MEEMRFSEQLKTYRKRSNLSQEELAERLYVTRQTISNWENKKSFPDLHNLFLLSNLFDVTLDDLVKGEEKALNDFKEAKLYKKIVAIRDLLSLVCVFLMLVGRNFIGEQFSIIIAVFGLIIFLVGSFLMRRIEKQEGIENNIYNLKETEDVLLFLENANMTQEKFKRIKQKRRKERFIKWGVTIICFISFIILSLYVSRLLL